MGMTCLKSGKTWYGIIFKIVKIYGMRITFIKTEKTWDGVILKKIENTQDRG